MIETSNILLFSISVTHDYYNNGICSLLNYVADEKTAVLFKKYSLKLRDTLSGFSLYQQSKSSSLDFLKYLQTVSDLDGFTFLIKTENNVIFDQTALPSKQLGAFLFDSSNVSTIDNQRTLNAGYVETTSNTVFGTIKIGFKDLIDANQSIEYQIHFKTRSSYWNYYFLSTGQRSFEDLMIKDRVSDEQFSTPSDVTLPNGEEAQLISSLNPLELSEGSRYKFDLMGTYLRLGKTNSKLIFRGLPNASPQNNQIISEEESNQMVSPIYVYI